VQFRYAIQIINFWYRRKIFQNRKNEPLAAQLPSVITRGTQLPVHSLTPVSLEPTLIDRVLVYLQQVETMWIMPVN
jgi:hypothetical protein